MHKNHHDTQRWQDTLEALASVKAGNVISGEKAHAWLDSWGERKEEILQIVPHREDRTKHET